MFFPNRGDHEEDKNGSKPFSTNNGTGASFVSNIAIFGPHEQAWVNRFF